MRARRGVMTHCVIVVPTAPAHTVYCRVAPSLCNAAPLHTVHRRVALLLCPPSRRIPHISASRCIMPTHPPAEAGGCAPLARRPTVGTSIFPTAYRTMTHCVVVVHTIPTRQYPATIIPGIARNARRTERGTPLVGVPVRFGVFLLLVIDHTNDMPVVDI